MKKQPSPGDTVRFTNDFLRNTGQYTGSAPRDKWIVQPCACGLCRGGKFIATNERNVDDDGQRHLNIGNIELVKTGGPMQHHSTKKSLAQIKREIDEVLAQEPGSSSTPRLLKVSRGRSFAGQRSITAEVQYAGEKPTRVEFVGPSTSGSSGPVVMVTKSWQTSVSNPSRFGVFGADWVRRFFA